MSKPLFNLAGKTPVPSDSRRQSVYAHPRVAAPLGGYRSAPMKQAIECWVQVLEQATVRNAEDFEREDWAYLASAMEGAEHSITPDANNPGELIKEYILRALAYNKDLQIMHRQKREAKEMVANLAERMGTLTYVEAWAVIWSLQWRDSRFKQAEEDDREPDLSREWWTLADREANVSS